MATKSKDNKYDKVKELLDSNMNKLTDKDYLLEFLKQMGRFHRYSVLNRILIYIQNNKAFKVAGYNKWKEMGRQVRQGEKGISVIAPRFGNRYWVKAENRYLGYDELTKSELKEAISQGLIEVLRDIVGYGTATVFDVSQTDKIKSDNEEQEEEQEEVYVDALGLHGKYKEVDRLLDALTKVSGVKIIRDSSEIGMDAFGCYRITDNTVHLRNTVDDVHLVKTAIHEVGHSVVKRIYKDGKIFEGDFNDLDAEQQLIFDRATEEVIVEASAFVVANQLGVDTSEYSLPYIASWSEYIEDTESATELNIGKDDKNSGEEKKEETREDIIRNRIHNVMNYIALVSGKILDVLETEFVGKTPSDEDESGEKEIEQELKQEKAESLLLVLEANAVRYKVSTGG